MKYENKNLISDYLIPYLPYAIMTLLLSYSWYVHVQHLDIAAAYNGFSVMEWLDKYLHPSKYVHDTAGGFEAYSHSAYMYIYIAMQKYTGISPEHMIAIMVAVNTLALATAFMHLTRAIIDKSSPMLVCTIVLLALSSFILSVDMGRWGSPIYTYTGTFYNSAIALSLFAISFWLRSRYIEAGFCLAISFLTHPTISLYAMIFMSTSLLGNIKELKNKTLYFGASLFFVCAGGWYLLMYRGLQQYPTVANDIWFQLTQLTNYHWYPVSFGLFGEYFAVPFYSFLCYCALLWYSLPRITSVSQNTKKMLIAGFLGILFTTLLGVLFSVLKISPTFIKLALQRSSSVLLQIGLIIIVAQLWSELKSAAWYRKGIVLTALITPFLSSPGLSFLNTLLVCSPIIFQMYNKADRRNWRDIGLFVYLLVMFGLALFYYYVGYGAGDFHGPALGSYPAIYTGSKLVVQILIASMLVMAVIAMINKMTKYRLMPVIVASSIFMSAAFWTLHQTITDKNYLAVGQAYKEVQLWAHNNTHDDTLFMVDPTIYYGWRAYSQRPSFGNLRDWLYAWCYTSNERDYQRGLQRFNEFNIDITPYLQGHNVILQQFDLLNNKIRDDYYAASDRWRLVLAKKYRIGYFVMMKSRVKKKSQLPIVYQNKYFEVLQGVV